MMDWSVVGGNPVPVQVGSVLGCARSLRRSARDLQRWQRDAQALFGRTATVWKGRAGQTYARSGTETVRQSVGWESRLHRAAEALVRFADEVEALQTRAAELATRACSYAEELHSIEIDQWYTIRLGIIGWTGDTSTEQALQIRLDAVRRLVEQVRQDFAEAERRVVQAIAEQLSTSTLIRAGSSLSASQQAALATMAVDETAGWFPVTNRLLAAMGSAQVAALFADLTPAAIRALALSDPAGVGNLDGVPLNARAMANQLLVERDRQLAAAAGDGKRLKVLDELIASGGSLVVYQPALDHYGVLFGDQEARHIAVLVPGVGSDASLGGWIGDAYSVWARSPGSAVIMWKGYDDPGDHGMIPDAANAGFNARATAGAQDLAGFADGLALTNGQSLTVIAHSYGTVVTGLALATDGLAPTNVVALGSPGMAVDDLAQLHLRAGQFYAEKAPGDPVANLLGGMGADPSAPGFGGTRLATNGAEMPGVQGHSQYFARDSQALDGISHVLTGSMTLGDEVGIGLRTLADPAQPGLDTLTRNYDGPGSGELQLADHLAAGLGSQLQSGVRNVLDSPGASARAVSHFFLP